ncbi:MAG: SPOR domain-containing protein [Erythrobacter sp.]
MIEAEYDEIGTEEGELSLTQEDSLPWLEADEDDDRAAGIDTAQMVGFIALLAAVGLVVVGLVWFVSNRDSGGGVVADGSTIEAPDGPYKVRPDEAGGKEFPGTGDVAPGVGEGQAPEARMANSTGAGAGDQDLNIPMPPIGDSTPSVGGGSDSGSAAAKGTGPNTKLTAGSSSSGSAKAGAGTASATGGVGVQLAAYSSKSRAEQGWRELQGKSAALNGVKHRVVEGQIDIGTVYRLQAVTSNRSAADSLCRALKKEGLDCQVKP